MHELSIVEGIMRQAERQRGRHRFSRVKAVDLVCGPHSCLAEETLQFLFDAVTRATWLEGARLRVTRLGEPPPMPGGGEGAPAPDVAVYIRSLEVE
ncbi:MAG: hydrogenase maturation nickel metallochaperone HypA [bacterium]|nr:hydrogenase maturation nickel metallochaperone HypA [bacterium]